MVSNGSIVVVHVGVAKLEFLFVDGDLSELEDFLLQIGDFVGQIELDIKSLSFKFSLAFFIAFGDLDLDGDGGGRRILDEFIFRDQSGFRFDFFGFGSFRSGNEIVGIQVGGRNDVAQEWRSSGEWFVGEAWVSGRIIIKRFRGIIVVVDDFVGERSDITVVWDTLV